MSEDINVGAISEALNNKMDRDGMNAGNPACVITETYHDNNGNWYRVYSDGWCEQGGFISQGAAEWTNIAFLKPYKDTNYTVLASQWLTNTANLENASVGVVVVNSGNCAITLYGVAGQMAWRASGYIR